MTISQGFGSSDTRSRARQGIPGAWVYADRNRASACGINSSPQTAQVGTIVVDTATASATYTWTINGVEMTYVADSSVDTTEVAAGIAAVINAEPLVRGQVRASAVTATVTLTATTAGSVGSFTASDSDAKLTTTEETTADDDADDVAFGRAIMSQGYASSESERLVCVPTTAKFSAQVYTLSIAFVDTTKIGVTVWEIRGSERIRLASVTETSATNRDTTIDALIVSLNAELPANTVLAAADNATATAIVFTAEIAGLEFEVTWHIGDEGASLPAISGTNTTGPNEATSLHRAWAGISLYSPSSEAAAVGDTTGVWGANEGVEYAKRGVVWVDSTQSPTEGDVVYVELTAGATAGRFYTDASSTRVALSRQVARWERDGLTASDSIAAVRLM